MSTRLTVSLTPEPGEIGRARALMDCFCERVAVSAEIRARVRLAVTEAATNCVLYAYQRDPRLVVPPFTLEARVEGGELVVLVHDDGVGVRGLQSGVHRGLGLRIIDHVADAAYVSSKPGRGTRIGMRFSLEGGE